jgi:TonB-dependent starch-binding outer membrane protein SusC
MKKINLGVLTVVMASGLSVAHAQKVKKDSVKSKAIDEVVVVAFGKQKKELVLGSNDVIKAEAIEKRPVSNIANAIEGSAPGIQVISASGQPGAPASIRVRGIGSYSLTNDPLYIVDGVPFSQNLSAISPDDIESLTILKDAASTSLYGSSASNGVVLITTKSGKVNQDLFTFNTSMGVATKAYDDYELVKDPMTYYKTTWEAIRNGRITNKGGSMIGSNMDDAGKFASLTLIRDQLKNNIFYIPDYTKLGATQAEKDANAAYYKAYYKEYEDYYNSTAAGIKGSGDPYGIESIQRHLILLKDGSVNPNIQKQLYNDFDWISPITQLGVRKNYNITYAGATNKTSYFFSAGYLNETGYMKKSDFERYNTRLKINSEISPWLKLGANLSATKSDSQQAVDGTDVTGFVNPYRWARYIGPIYPVYDHKIVLNTTNPEFSQLDTNLRYADPMHGDYTYDAKGNKVFDTNTPRGGSAGSGRNPVYENLLNTSLFSRFTLNSTLTADVKLAKNLLLSLNYGYTLINEETMKTGNNVVGDAAPNGNAYGKREKYINSNFNQLLTYKFKLGSSHNFEALLGHESFKYINDFLDADKSLETVNNMPYMDNYVTPTSTGGNRVDYTKEGYFSRLNYDYNGKYLLLGSLRTDASSRFYPRNPWGTFFSVGAGWLMHKENFLKNAKNLDFLKLRGSYGEVGNDGGFGFNGLNAFPNRNFYAINMANAGLPGILANPFGYDNIKWETNAQYDAAIEFKMFNSRFSGTVEYFSRKTIDMIFNTPVPVSAGNTNTSVATAVIARSNSIKKNTGNMVNDGIEITLKGDIIRKQNFDWSITLNATHYQNKVTLLPDEFKKNGILDGSFKLQEKKSRYDYYTRKWLGVDENTGRGLFVALDDAVINTGSNAIPDVYIYGGQKVTTNANKAKLDYTGDSSIPDVIGSISNYFRYKQWSLTTMFTYQIGGKVFDTPYRDMMNSNIQGQSIHKDMLNAWKKIGDQTDVPKIDNSTLASLQDNAASTRWLISASYFNFRSATLNYAFNKEFLDDVKIKGLDLYISAENIANLTARKGLDPTQSINGVIANRYDPARVVSVGMNVKF